MIGSAARDDLVQYLREARNALLWKLDGLSEYDVRRPLVPTGTNLLGLLKHVTSVTAGYFGDTFGRPFPLPPQWTAADAEPNADMWATADETRAGIVELYERVWAHADETIETLNLDSVGRVPWWPQGDDEVTLHHVIIRMIGEVHRHAGQADIVRELIDGSAGRLPDNPGLDRENAAWWQSYRDRLEQTARQAADA
jgi:hypothetical protein